MFFAKSVNGILIVNNGMNGDGGHVEPVGVQFLIQRKAVETFRGELDESSVTDAGDEAGLRLIRLRGRRGGVSCSRRRGAENAEERRDTQQ